MASAFLAGLGPGLMQAINAGRRRQEDPIQQQIRLLQLQNLIKQTQGSGELANATAGLDSVFSGSNPYAGLTDNLGQGGGGGMMPGRAMTDSSVTDPSERNIIQRESGGNPYVGYGGTDLSNAPLDQYGFPQWAGKMGPKGISHAAGLYQFQPGTWREGAAALGIKDFSPQSQKRVYDWTRRKYGATPWEESAPRGGSGSSAAPQAADDEGGGDPGAGDEGVGTGSLAPGFARDPTGGLTRNGQPPDTSIGGMLPGGGAVPAWREGPTQPGTVNDVMRQRLQELRGGTGPRSDAGGPDQVVGQDAPRGDVQTVQYGGQQGGTLDIPQLNKAYQQRLNELRQRIIQATPNATPQQRIQIWQDAQRRAKEEYDGYKQDFIRRDTERRTEQREQRSHDWQLQSEGRREKAEEGRFARGQAAQQEREQRALESQHWKMYEDSEGNEFQFNELTNKARRLGTGEPMEVPKGKIQPITHDKPSAAENINAYDADGKLTYHGTAVYKQGVGWMDKKGVPIDGRIERTGMAGAAAGGRAGAQVSRQQVSAREIMSDLQNAIDLPVSSTRGIFGGRSQGPGLMDALKENLAETATAEDDELMQSALSGLERELSIVVSPVYGGKWAADSFKALSIKPGQTANVKIYNLARMRQTADNALESIEHTDWVGTQQKEYAKYMRDELAKAIPWTPRDVIEFRRQGDDRETFGDFVRKQGISGAAGPQGQQQRGGTPSPPRGGQTEYARNPSTGQVIMRDQDGLWVPVPEGQLPQ